MVLFQAISTWILHESEAFIGKASKGDVVVLYYEPLATQHVEASGINPIAVLGDYPCLLLHWFQMTPPLYLKFPLTNVCRR